MSKALEMIAGKLTVHGQAIGEDLGSTLDAEHDQRVAVRLQGFGPYGSDGWIAATVQTVTPEKIRVLTDAKHPNASGSVFGCARIVDFFAKDLGSVRRLA